MVSAVLGAVGSHFGGSLYSLSLLLFFPWTLTYVLVGVGYVIAYGSVTASDTTVAIIASVVVLILGLYLLRSGGLLSRKASQENKTPTAGS